MATTDRLPNNPDYQRAYDASYAPGEQSAATMALVLETARLADAQEKVALEARTANMIALYTNQSVVLRSDVEDWLQREIFMSMRVPGELTTSGERDFDGF